MNCLTFSLARKLVNLFRNLNKFKHKRHIKLLMEEFAAYLTCMNNNPNSDIEEVDYDLLPPPPKFTY